VGGLPEIVDEGKTGYCVDPTAEAFAKARETISWGLLKVLKNTCIMKGSENLHKQLS